MNNNTDTLKKNNNRRRHYVQYRVQTTDTAKKIALDYLKQIDLHKAIQFGLPEIDDRYNIWRVPLKDFSNSNYIGEIVIDAMTSLVFEKKTTKKNILEARLLGRKIKKTQDKNLKNTPVISTLRNTVGLGDSESLLEDTPAESVDLVITSPPYFNARPEYSEYIAYEDYLLKIKKIIHQCHRVLSEGRFFVINVSPVLIRRASRNESSHRIAVPFDIHSLFIKEGFDFIDDIIWEKPEGAGWATGRGRRFAADRNPLQYKAVPVTEYILVYRKHSEKLIDWNIRKYPNREIVEQSKIKDDYEKTNIWKIKPAYSKKHPAIFPDELVEKIVRYYSFVNDVILDPFGGIGTVARVSYKLNRRFVYYEINNDYIESFKNDINVWYKEGSINWINTPPVQLRSLF